MPSTAETSALNETTRRLDPDHYRKRAQPEKPEPAADHEKSNRDDNWLDGFRFRITLAMRDLAVPAVRHLSLISFPESRRLGQYQASDEFILAVQDGLP